MQQKTKFLATGIIAAVAMITFFFVSSCSEDGNWGSTAEQFAFTIERDTDFPITSLNDTLEFKYNVKPSYTFSAISFKFKYTDNLSGALILNGQTLIQNVEYTLDKQENTFKYVGKEAGQHQIKITTKNEKGASVEEEFNFPYAQADFNISFVGGINGSYQGQAIDYTIKITPKLANDTGGYKIKFEEYDNNAASEIYFAGAKIELGKYYDISADQLNGVALKTIPYSFGSLSLTYTVTNKSGTTRTDVITQKITQNKISFASLDINKTVFNPGEIIIVNGYIIKTPKLSGKIRYKTSVTGYDNAGLLSEIQYTSGYVSSTINDAGLFTVNTSTLPKGALSSPYGTCKFNVQVEDEFGNESEEKSFNITIGAPLGFEGTPSGSINFKKTTIINNTYTYYTGFSRTFTAQASVNPIDKVKYDIEFYVGNTKKTYTYTDDITNTTALTYANQPYTVAQEIMTGGTAITNGKITITLIDIQANQVSAVVQNPTIIIN